MPVRSLNSSVFKWPKLQEVDRAARSWAGQAVREHPEVRRLGYFGSYARGDWGVGSDLDLIAIVDRCSETFERRSLNWNLLDLPVPAQLLIYTEHEWDTMLSEGRRFALTVEREAVWIRVRS